MTNHQWEDCENNKIDRLHKQANFRQNASLGDISYVSAKDLDKNMFAGLGTLEFVLRKENIIICCDSGTEKSYLS
ncbi:ATP-binding protein [Rhinopithecimicrobium faecis]|uniref:ATP-binding protein n=1 Tax=Rhinopithecimicrobium faecis TaxID=2820698 RepID=UPI0033656242